MSDIEVVKIEELPNNEGWLEFYSDGRVRAKNNEGQMIKHPRNFTPSEAAAAISREGAKKISADTTADLLSYLGLEGPFYEQLSKVMIKGGAGAVQASKELLKASREHGSFKGTEGVPSEGCPYRDNCLIFKARDREFTKEEVDAAAERIEVYREEIPIV